MNKTLTVEQLKKLVNETVEEYGDFPPAKTAGELAEQIRRILNHYFENDPFNGNENESYDDTMDPQTVLDLVIELMNNVRTAEGDIQRFFEELDAVLDKYFEDDPFTGEPNEEFDDTMSASDAVDQITDITGQYIDDGITLMENKNTTMTMKQLKRLVKESGMPHAEEDVIRYAKRNGFKLEFSPDMKTVRISGKFGSFARRGTGEDMLYRLCRGADVSPNNLDYELERGYSMKLKLDDKTKDRIKDVVDDELVTEEDSEERNPSLTMCDRCGRMFNDVNARIVNHEVLCPKCANNDNDEDDEDEFYFDDNGRPGLTSRRRGFGFNDNGSPRMYSEAHGDKNNRGWRKNKGTVKKESKSYKWGELKRSLTNDLDGPIVVRED